MSKANSSAFDTIFQNIQEYIETRLELFKLKMVDRSAEVFSKIAKVVIVVFFSAMFLIVFNIGLALLIGEWLGKSYYGFFVVAIFYVLLAFILIRFRKALIKNPLISLFLNKYLNKSVTWDE